MVILTASVIGTDKQREPIQVQMKIIYLRHAKECIAVKCMLNGFLFGLLQYILRNYNYTYIYIESCLHLHMRFL